ncbi:MAG TPA: expansin EXLX1 family cellulose-binding protein [Kofleriaceae bacterium]
MRLQLLVLGVVTACGACDDEPATPQPEPDTCLAEPAPGAGEATYYDANGSGNCSFDPSSDLMVAAINGVDYDNAKWCGACLAVTGPDGEVTVRVVDQCPGCAKGDLDLSREAFAKIAPLSAGRVDITWRSVACPVEGPVAYQFKDGSNAFWTAIQIRNHRYPIAKVEVRDDAGAFQSIGRLSYNYFVDASGLGEGPYLVRVTDTRGHVLEDMIALGDNELRQGVAQFPACP